jgi:V8-like Glu-specific endopeptidase
LKSLVILFLALTSVSAFALPVGSYDALQRSGTKVNKNMKALGYDFEGIVKLSNCSGSLIAFNGQELKSKAIIMTNGHCVQKPNGGMLSPGEVWVNRAAARQVKIFDSSMRLYPAHATKILYATMTNTDVAFYELTDTYEEIFSKSKIRPFLLDAKRPKEGISIDIISGYWDRGYSCNIDGFVFKLKEADWTFTDSIRYSAGCDTIGGTSGSPIIARGTRSVIAINNTSNEAGERCTINNPCEIDRTGTITATKGLRYGQQTFSVYSCLTPSFEFNLRKQGCTLPR